MEKKLAEYRKRKEREMLIQQQKQRIKTFFGKFFSRKEEKSPENELITEQTGTLLDNQPFLEEDITEEEEEEEEIRKCTYVDWLHYILWFALWVILYVIFIQLEFGFVYLMSSGLVIMYFNTRNKPKKSNEPSAYSVFNKNCESIDGTLKAEQFEKELLYGPSVLI